MKKMVQDSRYRTISKALQENQQIIRHYRDGTAGKPQNILKSQFQKLFPKGNAINSLEALDLTTLTFLFRILFNRSSEEREHHGILPDEDDSTLAGHLERLHFIRNWCYAHFARPKESGRNKVLHLEKALLGIGAKPVRRFYWQCVVLHPDMGLEGTLKNEIRSLIANDVSDIKQIMRTTQNLVNEHKLDWKVEMEEKVASIRSDFKGSREQIFSLLQSLPTDVLHAAMLHLEKLEPESPQVLGEEQTCMVKMGYDIKSKIEESKKELKEHIDKKIDSPNLQISVTQKCNFSQLTDDMHKLLTNREVFKVLVLSQPADYYHDDLDQLCFAIGSVQWDILVDLDHSSRTDKGLHEKIAKVMQRVKHYKVVSYTEFHMVTEPEEILVASGEKMLWILANGCADTGIKALKKNTKVRVLAPLEVLLTTLLSKLPGRKSLTCFNIILGESDSVPGIGQQILQRITACCEDSEDYIDKTNSQIYSLYTKEEDKTLVSDVSLKHEHMCLTHLDIATLLSKDILNNPQTRTYIYPGNENRECHVTEVKMAQFQVYIKLYHKDIGKINFNNKSESEIDAIVDKQRTNFLKGQPLTPEAQFLQTKCQMFVVRTEMENARKKVETILRDREEWYKKKPGGHFTIRHDSSGGGTTTARYLLYSLRNNYPCVEVRRIERETTQILIKIFKESKRPLLIVLDNHDFSAKSADELQQELTNEHVKALVVYVGRKAVLCFKRNQSTIKMDDDPLDENCEKERDVNDIYIPSKLEPEEKRGFKELYENIAEGIRASRVILYGLLAFCDEYDRSRLNEHIAQWFNSSTVEQKKALGVVMFIWKYCQKPVKVSLLSDQLTESNQESLWEQLFGYYGNDFVKTDKSDHYSACPVHNCIIEPIIEKLESAMNSGDKRTGMLKWFTETLHETLSLCDMKMEEMATTIRYLFIERPAGTYLSFFMTDLMANYGKDFAAEQILKFESLFNDHKQKSHMRALYARYLTYHMDQPEKGLHEITLAAGLKDGEKILSKHATKESAILATYGYLYRNKAQSVFENLVKTDIDSALASSVPFFSEAINALEKSQMASMDLKRYTVGPFLGEVKVRLQLLNFCFVNCCKRRHVEFRHFLRNTQYEVIKNSEDKAMNVLETVDHLERLNKLDELSVETSRSIVKYKFRLLRLRFDEQKTKKELIQSVNVENDLSLDIGLLIRLEYGKVQAVDGEEFENRLRHWSELRVEELTTIITFVQRKLEKQSRRLLASNFADILNAMIQIRYNEFASTCGQEGSYDQYNIDYAILCAEQWDKHFSKDQRALFYLGSLKLVKGLEDTNPDIIQEGVALLNRTNEICKENPYARDFLARTFSIGRGSGLSKLMPYRKDMLKEKLWTFEGRQINPTSMIIGVNPYQNILRAKMYREDSSHVDDGQQSKLKFCICLRQKFPVVAFHVEKV